MAYRRYSVISQPSLPGMEVDPLLVWMRMRRRTRIRKPRITAAERRLEAARRDPRQSSIYGPEHTATLTQF
ncbi:MAG TPA: hypothetical protein VHA06_21150 [Candidatus Angelobacter sp.]|nr:hypothetical protein [Candidatus Angelobacter sp.]